MNRFAQDLIASVAFLTLGGYGLWSLQTISARASLFPRLVFILMTALALILMVQSLVRRYGHQNLDASSPEDVEGGMPLAPSRVADVGDLNNATDPDADAKADGVLKRWLVAAAGLLAYVSSFTVIGFYTATFLLTLLMPIGLGYRRPLRALALAVGFTGSLFLIFTILLRRPLPEELPMVVVRGFL